MGLEFYEVGGGNSTVSGTLREQPTVTNLHANNILVLFHAVGSANGIMVNNVVNIEGEVLAQLERCSEKH